MRRKLIDLKTQRTALLEGAEELLKAGKREEYRGEMEKVSTLNGEIQDLEELVRAKEAGFEAGVCFVVQMPGMKRVEPNDSTHPEFGTALRRAALAGVEVLAVECAVTPDSLTICAPLPVSL